MDDKKILLQAEQICKTFDTTRAVDHVSLELCRGENGSGKSTFVSMLCGIQKLDSGSFTLDGKPYAPTNQVDANRNGVSIIVQESGTLAGLSVAENIFLGKEEAYIRHGLKYTADPAQLWLRSDQRCRDDRDV